MIYKINILSINQFREIKSQYIKRMISVSTNHMNTVMVDLNDHPSERRLPVRVALTRRLGLGRLVSLPCPRLIVVLFPPLFVSRVRRAPSKHLNPD